MTSINRPADKPLTVFFILSFVNRMKAPIVLSGISLGGWVVNLYRSFNNTARMYIPLLVGAAWGEVFVTSDYRRMTGRIALENPDIVRQTLNFVADFERVTDENEFPLLARYDRYIQYDVQKTCYGNKTIAIIENRHITSALNGGAIRKHILKVIKT
jgi:hypothetical protein